jgi:organic hydroperoxide reductase OsmC/OhrA
MTQIVGGFTIHIDQVEGYLFRTRFDHESHGELLMDEPPPLGKDAAPNPARILAAAIGNCLAASLQFCLARAGLHPTALSATAQVQLVRNQDRRLRVGAIEVTLSPELAASSALDECVGAFEDFCVVTESVRQGLDVRVRVEPRGPGEA